MAKNDNIIRLSVEELATQQKEISKAIAKANEEVLSAGAASFNGNSFDRGLFAPNATTVHGGYQDHNHAQQVKNMREADKAYREVGIVRNVIDIMTDFASEGLSMDHPIESQQRFYEAWAKKVNLNELARQVLQGMYKWGNVGVFKFWGKIRPKTKKEMMAKAKELFAQGKDKEATKAFFRNNEKFAKARIPVRYSCIPPFRIRIWGTVLFDDRKHFYHVSSLDRLKLENPADNASVLEKSLIDSMDPGMRNQLQRDGFIEFPQDNFNMFHYKRDCSRLWSDPLILPVMDDLRYKKLLRRLDMSVAESIINPITVFKLGKTVEGFAPTKEMFQNLATLLKTPVQTKTLIWSDLIEVEQHHIDASEVLSMEKYQEVNDAILAGLGISSVLINGGNMSGGKSSGGFAGAFLSVRTLLERLEDARNIIIKFLRDEVSIVRKAMGWKRDPIISWSQMSLKDEAAEKRIVMDLLDRKVISAESALNFLGFDKDVEMRRKVREDKLTDKSGTVHSVGPYEEAVRVQGDSDPARLGIDVQEKQLEIQEKAAEEQTRVAKQQAKETKQDGPSRGPGRTADRGDTSSRRQTKERKPRVTAVNLEVALKNRESIEDWFKPLYLESIKKSNLRQLTAKEKRNFNSCILAIYASMPNVENYTESLISAYANKLLQTGFKIDSKYRNIRSDLIEQFVKENNCKPKINGMKKIDSESYIIYKQI